MRIPSRSSRRGRRGNSASALLAVFWAIAVLGLTVFGISQFVLDDMESVNRRRDDFDARLLAERALALAAHPQVSRDDPLLSRTFDDGRSYRGRIIGEGARLNLNAILLRAQTDILEKLFASWGMAITDTSALIGALEDWVDPDDLVRFGGAEKRVYEEAGLGGRPYNRPFRSLAEVDLVRGADLLNRLRPDWRDSFTLWSDGLLDLSYAEAPLIAAASGTDEGLASEFVVQRRGPDGIDGTDDDAGLESLDSALAMLQVPSDLTPQMAQRLTTRDQTTRLIGEGTAHGVTVRQIVVVRNRQSRPTVLHFWEGRVQPGQELEPEGEIVPWVR